MSVELISKGSYGCVYKGIKCNERDKIKKDEISKLQVINKFSAKEMRISEKIIRDIKDHKKYYAPIINSCRANLMEIKEDIKDCDVLDDEKDGFILNKMRYVGDKTLIKKLFDTKKNSGDELFLRQYFNTYIKLFESIKKLNDIGIIHMDLKGNNVMYLRGKPIIIDFGLSLDKDRIKTDKEDVFFVYAHDYEPWCIDITLITYIVTNKLDDIEINERELNKICDNFIDNNTCIRAIRSKKEEFKNNMKDYIENYKGKKYKELYEDLLKGSNTWDIHSLVVMYFYFLFHSYVTGESDEEKLENFNRLPNEILELLDIQQEYIITMPGKRDEKIKEKILESEKKILNMKKKHVVKIDSNKVMYKLLKKSYRELSN
jgi:tRNA A-37 threonylcarbamoyl transferase component Bud32